MSKIHFMGIGGSGISAIARIAREYGHEVSGCDLEESPITSRLRREGINVDIGHDASHLKKVDYLIHTPAVFYQSQTNKEYLSAFKKGIALTWEEFMAKELMTDKFVVAVAGTHGKGTAAAMLSFAMEKLGMDPTCEIGANLLDWGRKNYRIGKSKYFVCEADEYREKFLLYHPNLLLITSIEMDHPDYFGSFDDVLTAFVKLIKQMKDSGIVVINNDDEGCQKLIKKLNIKNIIKYSSKNKLKLKLPGDHLRSDAAGVFEAIKALGGKEKEIKEALAEFSGLERRFEFRGEVDGAVIYDDYAHHPTAVRVNIEAARELHPKKKIWVVLQPHMHARLSKLFDEFSEALKLADRAIVTDVYTRRESGVSKPTGKELALAAGKNTTYVGGDLINVANFVGRNVEKGDVILVMGAGDSYRISDYLLQKK